MDDKNSSDFSLKKSEKKINTQEGDNTQNEQGHYSIWVSVSEAAKLGGVQDKTVRRAIKANAVKYKIVGNRYQINFYSFLFFLHQTTKLKNKLNQFGLGQHVEKWKL